MNSLWYWSVWVFTYGPVNYYYQLECIIWINHGEIVTAVIPVITVLPTVLPNVLPLVIPVVVSQVILPELVIPVVAVVDPLITTFTLHTAIPFLGRVSRSHCIKLGSLNKWFNRWVCWI